MGLQGWWCGPGLVICAAAGKKGGGGILPVPFLFCQKLQAEGNNKLTATQQCAPPCPEAPCPSSGRGDLPSVYIRVPGEKGAANYFREMKLLEEGEATGKYELTPKCCALQPG